MIQASAFILIGGKSERFGSPKWQTVIDGKSILDHTWNMCSDFEHRLVIGKNKPKDFKKPFIHDELKIQAPINGLYTALKHTKTDWILLVSCDLPLIDANVFETLWDARTENVDAVIPIANDRHQVTCAFYHKNLLPILESALQNKDYSLYSFVEKLNSIKIEFGGDKRFWNMNTQDDLAEILTYFFPKK